MRPTIDEEHRRALEADDPTSDLLPEGELATDEFLALPPEARLRIWDGNNGEK